MAKRTGEIIAAFSRMCVDHDAMPLAFDQMDAMRVSHAVGRRGPRRIGFLFAPSHAGKSSLIDAYKLNRIVPELVNEDPALADIDPHELAYSQKRVLHVTLGEHATVKSLASDILIALEDNDPYTGTSATLWRRVHRDIEKLGVQLLVIDELQHLATSNTLIGADYERAVTTRADHRVTDALKVISIRGSVPVVFAGIEQARAYVAYSTQLTGRGIFDLHMPVYDWSIPEHRRGFTEFAGRLAIEMKKLGLVEDPPPLIYGDTIVHLWQASQGRLGMLCRIVEKATIVALYAERRVIKTDDLLAAVDAVCVARGFIPENPFHRQTPSLELK